MQTLFDFGSQEENNTNTNYLDSNNLRLFRWKGLDNRLLCIPHDENMVGEEVSCFTELNEDMTFKEQFHETYKCMMKVTRHLSMEDVIEYKPNRQNEIEYK